MVCENITISPTKKENRLVYKNIINGDVLTVN